MALPGACRGRGRVCGRILTNQPTQRGGEPPYPNDGEEGDDSRNQCPCDFSHRPGPLSAILACDCDWANCRPPLHCQLPASPILALQFNCQHLPIPPLYALDERSANARGAVARGGRRVCPFARRPRFLQAWRLHRRCRHRSNRWAHHRIATAVAMPAITMIAMVGTS